MDTRITKPSHRWLKAPTVHRTALPIRFEVSGASNEGREPETRYRMACAAIAAHQRCCLPGSLKTTDEGLKKKLAWLAFAGKNRGWEKFSVPGSRVFCAVRTQPAVFQWRHPTPGSRDASSLSAQRKLWLSQIDLWNSKHPPNASNRLLVNLTQISGDLKKNLRRSEKKNWTGLDCTGALLADLLGQLLELYQ